MGMGWDGWLHPFSPTSPPFAVLTTVSPVGRPIGLRSDPRPRDVCPRASRATRGRRAEHADEVWALNFARLGASLGSPARAAMRRRTRRVNVGSFMLQLKTRGKPIPSGVEYKGCWMALGKSRILDLSQEF